PGRIFGQAAVTTPKHATTAKAPAAMPTDGEIARAKAKGMVWVTKDEVVYHKDDPEYGMTKNGKFMTEADAQKEGYSPKKSPSDNTKKTYDKATEYDKGSRGWTGEQ